MKLFEINNLKCSYNNKDIVLEVDHLIIPKGKLVTIVGLSGAGKSTFLETLGLMNNTFQNGSEVLFYPNGDDSSSFDLNNIWSGGNDALLSEIRRQHFSFIFQSTNLMSNFTTYENVCLTQMLQGKSFMESMDISRKMMNMVGLEEISEQKNTFEISGGQRQRVAFVRAITPDYSVLFGDEPTGNLDEKNSRDLMYLMKQKIEELNKTAIIVTHNIEMALEFADSLIVISKPNAHGVIIGENVFNINDDGSSWVNLDDKVYDRTYMINYLKTSLGK